MYQQDTAMRMLMSVVFGKLPINMPALCERTLMCSAARKAGDIQQTWHNGKCHA